MTTDIEILGFCDAGDEEAGLFAKGHFDAEDFVAAIDSFLGHVDDYDASEVKWAHWRDVFAEPDSWAYLTVVAGSAGAYPVTFVEN